MTNKIWIVLVVLLATLSLAGICLAEEAPAAEKPTLRIANWSLYIDFDDSLPEDLPAEQRSPTLREFAEKFDCNIEYHEFETFDAMLAKFTVLSGFYDIMVLSCGYTKRMIGLDWMLPIPEEKVPNLKLVDDVARRPEPDPEGKYLIPYLNDYVGLAFRGDLIGRTNLTWAEYFDPPESWKGHVGIYAIPPVMFALSIISGGHDYTHATSAEFAEAQKKISYLRNNFAGLITDDSDVMRDKLLSGELWAIPMYAPNAQYLLDRHDNINFIIPSDGTEYYYDYFVVSRDSQNKDLAFEFINFVLEPEVLGRIAAYLGASATSPEARAISNKLEKRLVPYAITPDGKALPGLQITFSLSPEIDARWLAITSEPLPADAPLAQSQDAEGESE